MQIHACMVMIHVILLINVLLKEDWQHLTEDWLCLTLCIYFAARVIIISWFLVMDITNVMNS